MVVRTCSVALVALLFLPGVIRADVETLREQSQQVVDARGLRVVRVENPRGLVEVRPSADGRIHVTALKTARSMRLSLSREYARSTQVELSRQGERYTVRVRYPQRQGVRVSWWQLFSSDFTIPRADVELALEIPPGLSLEVVTASGDIETSDLAGAQSLQTTSGDMDVRGAAASVTVATTSGDLVAAGLRQASVRSVSGDVSVDDARGSLDVRTTSGDIELRGVTDSLALSSGSGDIWVDRAPRGISASTSSGGIVVDGMAAGVVRLGSTSGEIRTGLDRGLVRADANTVSGEIQVRLADGLACTLEITSTSGALDSSVPLQIRAVTRQRMSGTVRGGGPPVVLHSVSGDIAVTGGGR